MGRARPDAASSPPTARSPGRRHRDALRRSCSIGDAECARGRRRDRPSRCRSIVALCSSRVRRFAMRTGSLLLSVAAGVLVATTWVAASRQRPAAGWSHRAGGRRHRVALDRLRRLRGVPDVPSGRLRAMAGVAAHPDDAPGRRGHRARRLLGPGRAHRARPLLHVRPRQRQADVTVRAGGRPAETYRVDYTLGSKRFQGYLSTLPDGRMYVLPVFWQVDSGRWLDWKETTPIPDGAHDLKQIWNVNCFNCHATNLDRGYQPATRDVSDATGPNSASAARPATALARNTSRSPSAGTPTRRRCRPTARVRRTASSATR